MKNLGAKSDYIKYLLLTYFKLLLIVSILGKLFFPTTALSYIISFVKRVGLARYFGLLNLFIYPHLIYSLLICIEVVILFFSVKNIKIFIRYISAFNLAMLLISSSGFFLNINADCGCFGEIITFSNSLHKIIFNLFNLLLGIVLIYVNQTHEHIE